MQSFSHQQMGAKNVSRPAKAALICQILRRLIAQYCRMNKRRRVTEGHGCIVAPDGERGGYGGFFLIRTVHLVSAKTKQNEGGCGDGVRGEAAG